MGKKLMRDGFAPILKPHKGPVFTGSRRPPGTPQAVLPARKRLAESAAS